MNIALWIAQGLLAAMYLMAGSLKTFQAGKAKEQMSWAKESSDGYIHFVGISELLGALGLVLPLATGILRWLTPLAALGLTVIQLLAILIVHLPKKEFKVIPVNVILLALSAFIIAGRWELFVK